MLGRVLDYLIRVISESDMRNEKERKFLNSLEKFVLSIVDKVISNKLDEYEITVRNIIKEAMEKHKENTAKEQRESFINEVADAIGIDCHETRDKDQIVSKIKKLKDSDDQLTKIKELLCNVSKAHYDPNNSLYDNIKSLVQELETSENNNYDSKLPDGICQCYKNYKYFGYDLKNELNFPDVASNRLEAFVAVLSQEETIEKIWNASKKFVENDKLDEIVDMLKKSIAMYNYSQLSPLYEVMIPIEGEEFDYNKHSTEDGSSMQGTIKNVCVPGYKNTYSDSVVKKSIVEVY